MTTPLRTALHRLVDACIVLDETEGERAPAEALLWLNISRVLELLGENIDAN